MSEAPGLPERELSISWSRLKAWEECSEQGYLLGRGFRSPLVDLRVFFKGTVVDRAMRKWLDMERPEPGWMASKVHEIFDAEEEEARASGDGVVGWKSTSDRNEIRAWCLECVTRLEPLLFRVAIPYNYQPAVRFKLPMTIPYLDGTPQRIWLNGEMDLLCEEPAPDGGLNYAGPKRIHVWDLKATTDPSYYRKALGQLVFYDIAAFIMFKTWPVKSGIIQPMVPEQLLPFTLTMDHRREILARITKVAEQQWKNDHRPKASNAGCDWCPVKHACPKWRVEKRGKAPIPQ